MGGIIRGHHPLVAVGAVVEVTAEVVVTVDPGPLLQGERGSAADQGAPSTAGAQGQERVPLHQRGGSIAFHLTAAEALKRG